MKFVHLHNHSDYSILDGAITVERLVAKTKEQGIDSVALTDHGNMFGAIQFYLEAVKQGIKPIIGEEFYYAPESRFKREVSRDSGEDISNHLVLLAKNLTGYRNLLKLSSIGYTEGFYYKPRIDWEVLEKHSEGIICSTACIAGQVPRSIVRGDMDKARKIAGRFHDLFGKGNFYLEMQYHGIPEEATVNRELVKMSKQMNIPLICTNDAHYVNREDAYAHEVLLCNQTGKTMSDENRMRFHSDDFYLKSPEEMLKIFSDYPEALTNTWEIAQMIDLELELGNPILPEFIVPDGFDLDSYLIHLVYEGAKKLYGERLPEAVKQRIDYELSVITSMKFSGYFLIVWDVINYSRSRSIPVGPGRGSAAGSIVSYCLGITSLDPLRYDLLFERFLNPDRNEMPDMDLDFCAERREEVIQYVKTKYGEDRVSQIITFNTMSAKAVLKDVARAFDVPFQKANEITKLIDGSDLRTVLNSSKELKKYEQDEEVGHEVFDISLRLQGLVKSAGKHAAGIVISRGPLTDYVPLYRDKDGSISSQFEKNTLEKAGLVKMDFLGLKNLTIIDKCLRLILKTTGENIDIERIPLDDSKTFDLLQRADTHGVFQLESSGMQDLLSRLGPTTFEDIIAINALYRPGPLNSGMTEDFIRRKNDPGEISYPHDSLEPVLKDTLGVIVYQEQVMLISQVMGGFTLPEADKLRKAMGKKIDSIMEELKPKFVKGAIERGVAEKVATNIYDMMGKFAEYGFNKSHSAAYAMVTYQTAFLKAYYPLQFMATLLSAQPDKQEDIIKYINSCKASGMKVLPPSINHSEYDFTIENDTIRFGLGAVKGLGGKAIERICQCRERIGAFSSLRDFLEQVDSTVTNKGVLEALIKSGALDPLYPERGRLFANIELIVETARSLRQDKVSGQGDLFSAGIEDDITAAIDLPSPNTWDDRKKFAMEKEVLGIYITGHPLHKYEKVIKALNTLSIKDLSTEHNGKEVSIVGIVTNLQIRISQKGRKFAAGTFEDFEGSIDLLVFKNSLDKFEGLLMSDEPLLLTGKIETENENTKKMICSDVKTLKEHRHSSISALHIMIERDSIIDDTLSVLRNTFLKYKGDCPVYFHVKDEKMEQDFQIIKAHSTFNVAPTERCVDDICNIVGKESIRYSLGSGGRGEARI